MDGWTSEFPEYTTTNRHSLARPPSSLSQTEFCSIKLHLVNTGMLSLAPYTVNVYISMVVAAVHIKSISAIQSLLELAGVRHCSNSTHAGLSVYAQTLQLPLNYAKAVQYVGTKVISQWRATPRLY